MRPLCAGLVLPDGGKRDSLAASMEHGSLLLLLLLQREARSIAVSTIRTFNAAVVYDNISMLISSSEILFGFYEEKMSCNVSRVWI